MPPAGITGLSQTSEHKSHVGAMAEALAADFLLRSGATILDRNVRVDRGEIDLLAMVDNEKTVVEVRAITSGAAAKHHGLPQPHPLDAFDAAKALQVRKLAGSLQCRRVDLIAVRFHSLGVDLHWVKRVGAN